MIKEAIQKLILGSSLTEGDGNVLLGYQAGDPITTGSGNICIGYQTQASANNQDGVAIGRGATVNHNNSVVFGQGTFSDADNTFKIGNATTVNTRLI